MSITAIIKAHPTTGLSPAEEVKSISVVIPVYNEEGNVSALAASVKKILQETSLEHEVVFVDDGSTDGTTALLKQLHDTTSGVKVLRFRRNFGQTAALAAGFDYAKGDVVVTMDGDLQNDAEDIPLLLEKITEGYDIVNGWRFHRQDPFWQRRLPSKVANWLISWATGIPLQDWGCGLKAYHRDVVKGTTLYGELHRFIPAVANIMGVKVAEVPVRHHPRRFGKSKYGLSRTIRVLLDLLTVRFLFLYSTRPLHFFGGIGLGSIFLGFLVAAAAVAMKLFQDVDMSGNPLLILSVLFLLSGGQFITAGLLGEMIVRTYHESQGKPIYYIREIWE